MAQIYLPLLSMSDIAGLKVLAGFPTTEQGTSTYPYYISVLPAVKSKVLAKLFVYRLCQTKSSARWERSK